jgi:hypothetical protein
VSLCGASAVDIGQIGQICRIGRIGRIGHIGPIGHTETITHYFIMLSATRDLEILQPEKVFFSGDLSNSDWNWSRFVPKAGG